MSPKILIAFKSFEAIYKNLLQKANAIVFKTTFNLIIVHKSYESERRRRRCLKTNKILEKVKLIWNTMYLFIWVYNKKIVLHQTYDNSFNLRLISLCLTIWKQ